MDFIRVVAEGNAAIAAVQEGVVVVWHPGDSVLQDQECLDQVVICHKLRVLRRLEDGKFLHAGPLQCQWKKELFCFDKTKAVFDRV